MTSMNFEELDQLIQELGAAASKDDSLLIAIKIANEFMRIVFPSDERGQRWSAQLCEDEYLLDKVISVSAFPNQKVETWFEQHPYIGGERAAFEHFRMDEAPLESKFYWLNKSSAKSRIAAGVALTPNWEDNDLCKTPNYKVGIDFFLTSDCSSVLVVLSNEGRLRVLELSERLTNTQRQILSKVQNAAKCTAFGEFEPQRTIHGLLWGAFALQAVNKAFYEGVAEHFNVLAQHLKDVVSKDEDDAKQFANRLVGRLLFIWFLRKKKFINEAVGYFENAGLPATDYYEQSLKALFFQTLNKPVEERTAVNGSVDKMTPFLNGGLFDARENDWVDETINFPPDWFDSLFKHFSNYNFTTDESTPDYEQVAIDPEMLGRVFENLLASQVKETGETARNEAGAFYTPREVVAYMCKESLRSYLHSSMPSERGKQGVDALLDMPDRDFEIKHSDFKKSLWGVEQTAKMTGVAMEALRNLRLCDPACGSGAFPMGMLQLLVKTYRRLGCDMRAHDLKLQILGTNMYGVDLEPMAVEIARLRAWLSIIVEESDPKKVQPLPNLDFRFVCANALVKLPAHNAKGQGNIFDLLDDDRHKNLDDMMARFFAVTNPQEKQALKQEYFALQDSLKGTECGDGLSERLKWDPFDASTPAPFFDPSSMFNLDEGFSMVIGNPPYIQLQGMTDDLKTLYQKQNYSVHESRGDIYCLFYERGFELLREGGVLCFITSNKWMRAAYGEKLRNYFVEQTTPLALVDFAGVKVFESATVDVNILLAQNRRNPGCTKAEPNAVTLSAEAGNAFDNYVKKHAAPCIFEKGASWTILSDIERSIKSKIEAAGVPLKDWDIKINYGIKTGCNEAFIIDGATKDRLIAEDARSAEIIRPILRGKDIKRYHYEFADHWLIATFPAKHYDIDDFPAVKKYLQSFDERCLAQTGEKDIDGIKGNNARKRTSNKWFETQDTIAYWEDFSQTKIAWGNLCLRAQFALVEESVLINAPANLITPAEPWLLAYLNSSIADWYIHLQGVTRNGGFFEYQQLYVGRIPVPKISQPQKEQLKLLTEKLKDSGALTKVENEIDHFFADLMKLTAEELKLVQNA